MSLLDDARKIADPYSCPQDERECWYCAQDINSLTSWHAPDCPWLSMPKIVAALEAVYGLMQSEDGAEPIEGGVWAFCQRPVGDPHWDRCLWVKLCDLVYRDSAP